MTINPRCVFKVVCIVLMLAPLAVVSTPPELPPYYAYNITDQVMRSSDSSLENIPVVLAARCGGEWRLIYPQETGCGYVFPDKGVTLALTRSNGRVSLSVYVQTLLDSMAIAVVFLDTVILGKPFSRRSAQFDEPIEEEYWHEDDSFLCSDSIELRSKAVGWQYDFAPDTVIVD